MELFALNSFELMKKKDYFLFTLIINFCETKVKKVIKLDPISNNIIKSGNINFKEDNNNYDFDKKKKLKIYDIKKIEENRDNEIKYNYEENEKSEDEKEDFLSSYNHNNNGLNELINNFPYQPYPEQNQYMKQILLCLNSNEKLCNALLESPTGQGKHQHFLIAYWLGMKIELIINYPQKKFYIVQGQFHRLIMQ